MMTIKHVRPVPMGNKRSAVPRKQAGFTIIELLIATLVFALVLVIITVSVLTFTKTYFRGVNQAATQTAARTIAESIAQAIQFSGNAVNPQITAVNSSNGFCIGNQRYSYILYWQLVDGTPDKSKNQTNHAFMMDSSSSCAGAPSQDMLNNAGLKGTELLPTNMRLAKLRIEQVGDPTVWKVTIRIVYGDNDLLCSPAVTGDCASTVTTSPIDKSDLSCKAAFSGSQYCATSELSTIVKKRVTASQ